MMPQAGDVLRIGPRASVQFATPILFRMIRVLNWQTTDGWVWLDGYQILPNGDAIEHRSIFVMINGLEQVAVGPHQRTDRKRKNDPAARTTTKPPGKPRNRPPGVGTLPDPTRRADPEPAARAEPHARDWFPAVRRRPGIVDPEPRARRTASTQRLYP
jgi:hypothetical protein